MAGSRPSRFAVTEPIKNNSNDIKWKIHEWWDERKTARCQLHRPEEFIEGLDYFGYGPWYEMVAVNALKRDFCAWNNQEDQVFFAVYFKAVTGHQNMMNKQLLVKGKRGFRVMRTIRFVRFW